MHSRLKIHTSELHLVPFLYPLKFCLKVYRNGTWCPFGVATVHFEHIYLISLLSFLLNLNMPLPAGLSQLAETFAK